MPGHEAEEGGGAHESLFGIVNKVAGFHIGSAVSAEDLSDKVNYKFTSRILMLAAILIVMRDFIFKPIQCYVPSEWPHPWEEFAENFCWVQNNYVVSYLNASFPGASERSSLEINYYQWVPFVLALECLLAYLPHLAWRFLSHRSGFDPNGLVRLAKSSVQLDDTRQGKLVVHLVSELDDAMGLHLKRRSVARSRRSPVASGLLECARSTLPCFWMGRRSGFALFFLYLVSKLIYLLAGLGHLFLMRSFLGFEDLAFGWNCARDLLQGRQWPQTRVFPRVTFCDVPIKHVGQWNTRSIQCVMPLNVLNEKLYIFLWFWVVMCLTLTVVSTVVWLVFILSPKLRLNFVEKHFKELSLLVAKAQSQEECRLREEFVSDFLSIDGLFLLVLIKNNVGSVCFTEVIFALYGRYKTKRCEEDHPKLQGSDSPDSPLSQSHSSLSRRQSRPQESDD